MGVTGEAEGRGTEVAALERLNWFFRRMGPVGPGALGRDSSTQLGVQDLVGSGTRGEWKEKSGPGGGAGFSAGLTWAALVL